jgi:cytidylate kinase
MNADEEVFMTLHSVIAAVTVDALGRPLDQPDREPRPFITISRQASAGGMEVMHKLLDRLRKIDPATPPWTGWHRELVERVASDHNLYKPLVENLTDESESWLQSVLKSFDTEGSRHSEYAIYRRVAHAVRALAQMGRVVIVGRGGVFITRDMPQGIHVYLVAPLEIRIARMSREMKIPEAQAAKEVRRIDRNRAAFFSRYFPNETVAPESFAVTFNTAVLSDDQIADMIVTLLPGRSAAQPSPHPTAPAAHAPNR